MIFRRIFLLLLLASIGSSGSDAGAHPAHSGLRLNGTFIQYQDWMMKLDRAAWHKELDAMRRAGIDQIVVQWLQEDHTAFIPASLGAVDPTEVILDYADRHGMRLFVGLTMDADWWNRWADADYLDRTAAANIAIARRAWSRYGGHRSFAGWYIPQETWDIGYDRELIDRLAAFFHRVSAGCRVLSGGKPVAMAPFFGHNVTPDIVEQVYKRLLAGAGIDILMLQDGVGANGWDQDVDGNIRPDFRAFQDACRENRVALWSDLESFRTVGQHPQQFAPAAAERIGRQLAAEAPFVRRFVTFDFFHYMSPYRGAAQQQLYRDYLRDYVDHPFLPRLQPEH